MAKKAIYQLSARQIILLTVGSGLAAVAIMAFVLNFGIRQGSNPVLAEQVPAAEISDPSSVSEEQNSIEVYRAISPGVVFITTSSVFENYYGEEFERERGNGSGSVIDDQGHILTNYHVVEGASKLTVSFGGDKVYPAEIVGGDPDTDLAIIKLTPPREGLTVLQLSDSDSLAVGQKVLAIGNPFGLDRTLTTGVISGLQRPIRARNGRPIEGAIQTDASINPGNSGGPLLDKFGKMIGINSQILSPAGGSVGVGFAIPANIAKRVIPQLIQFGEVRRPKLGASLYGVGQLRERGMRLPVEKGLLVRSVLPGSSLEAAGIRGLTNTGKGTAIGDIITSIDGTAINDLDDLYRFLDKKQIGDTVQVEVLRDGASITVPVKLTPSSERGSVPSKQKL